MYTLPSEIEYGVIRNLRFVADFGRFEAKVLLHLSGGQARSDNLEFLVNVPAREGEPFEDTRLRLVMKAARLYRLHESGLNVVAHPQEPPLAA